VVGKEGVSINVVQVTLIRMRATCSQLVDFLCGLEAKQIIKPALEGIVEPVTDRLV
jgi:hypothetical protein